MLRLASGEWVPGPVSAASDDELEQLLRSIGARSGDGQTSREFSSASPTLNLRLKGVKRQSAVLWYGEHYPITPDMPGRKLFGSEAEFWNPDLPPPQSPCDQLIAAGQRHIHQLIAYARSRGIDASMVSSLTDLSQDFRSVVPDAHTVNQLGQLTVAPGPAVRPDNPELAEIGGTVLRTLVDEFPDAHSYGFAVGTECPSWIDWYKWAWQ